MDVTQLTFGQLKYLRFIQDHPGSSKIIQVHPGFIQESCMLDESFRFIQVKWRFCRSIEVVSSECVFVVVWSNGFIALPAQNQLCTLKSEVRFPCIGWSDVRMDESRCPGELKPHFDHWHSFNFNSLFSAQKDQPSDTENEMKQCFFSTPAGRERVSSLGKCHHGFS